MPKYELIHDDSISVLGSPAYRIRALRDIPEHGVRAGDLGGYVEGEHNLSHDGAAWIANKAMAIQRGRVEGEALATGLAIISDHALITQRAILRGLSQARGCAVIRGSACLSGLSAVSGRVLLDEKAHARGGAYLTGDGTYTNPTETAWSLATATSTDPDFWDHLREAAAIDPSFDLIFGQLGAQEPAKAIDHLTSTHRGRHSLRRLVRHLGGTFHPKTYCPRDARDVTTDTATEVAVLQEKLGFTGFRSICTVTPNPVSDPDTNQRWHAGALQAIFDRASTSLFQSILLEDVSRPQTLPPLPLRMTLLPDVYATSLDAENAALSHLETMTSEMSSERDYGTSNTIAGSDLNALPIILSARGHGSGATRFTLTRQDRKFLSLIVPDHLCADLNFSQIVSQKSYDWTPDQITAVAEPYTFDINLPAPSTELSKALSRADHTQPPEGQNIMKRDMDLIRDLLFNIEEDKNINGKYVLSDADFSNIDADPNAVQYHLRLLLDAGYIEGRDLLADTPSENDTFNVMRQGTGSQIAVERLTWEGHEFLDTVRDNQVWQKTKGYLQNVGGVGIDVLKEVAKAVVKDQIKQYTGITFSSPK